MPVAHALAYAIEVLPALGYLHDRGLVYCDFKPDNVIQTEEQLKLIDMGGVRGDDSDGPIYGTIGYQAPEIGTDGPSVSSDLFTVARALAILTFEFKGYQSTYKFTFPDGIPLLEQQESFSRLLHRATDADPDRRFGSAGEMAEQLTGVLREVLAVADGTPRPAFSTVFSPELQAIGTGDDAAGAAPGRAGRRGDHRGNADAASGPGRSRGRLPGHLRRARFRPASGRAGPRRVGRRDRAGRGGQVRRDALGAGAGPARRRRPRRGRGHAGRTGRRGPVRLADRLDRRPAPAGAGDVGTAGTATGASTAGGAFSAVYDDLPGELAPKLALGFAAEAAGDAASASRYFRLVWTVDRSCISAAFGLARTCLAAGDRPGAIAALAAVPETSSHHAAAQIAAVRILVSPGVTGNDLRQADRPPGPAGPGRGAPPAAHRGDPARRARLGELRAGAGIWAGAGIRAAPGSGRHASGDGLILGCEPNERALRFGLERSYRALARLTSDRGRRIELVDMANAIRPRTWS